MGTKAEYQATVYSYDRVNDLAILITDKYLPPLPTIQPGNEAHVGQWVMAVGSPGAGNTTLDGSITTGTITNIQEGVVITDTTINPGNSGGPLLNAAGQVIAVVSAKIVDAKIDSIGIARDVALICDQLDGCSKKRLLR
jgi:serine protease Do